MSNLFCRRRSGLSTCLAAGSSIFLFASQVWAGMPQPPTLTGLAQARLNIISFFVVAFLIMSLAFMLIWNSLRKSFPSLPVLTYRRALAFVGLWAAVFILILTMISGARELMTPGAWEKSGSIYKLAGEE